MKPMVAFWKLALFRFVICGYVLIIPCLFFYVNFYTGILALLFPFILFYVIYFFMHHFDYR